MSGEQNELSVYESPTFTKNLKKLSQDDSSLVEDEIDVIIVDP